MKRLNNFWFGVLLVLSVLIVIWAFDYARDVRGYGAIGGEVFTIALPLLIVRWKLWTVEQEYKERLQQLIQHRDQHSDY
jgi:hypothetical protein